MVSLHVSPAETDDIAAFQPVVPTAPGSRRGHRRAAMPRSIAVIE
jgi:hypothetical protein